MLRPIVGISKSNSEYEIALITGSGTAANEAVLSSVCGRGPVLVVSNGEFGERLAATARQHSPDAVALSFAWQQSIDLDRVEIELRRRQYHLVVVVHHETSTGMLNPVAALAELAHRYGALIVVDAISSIGAEAIAVEEWDIDVLTGTSGKALSAMPGVGIVVIKTSVLEQSASVSAGPRYLNLHMHCRSMRDHEQTPNTPAVHVFVSLHASLQQILRLGVAEFRKVIHSRAVFTRRRLTAMGLDYVDYPVPGATSSVVTCVSLPVGLSFDSLAGHLKSKGIVVYDGKGVLANTMFQIGHIGALRRRDTSAALRQVRAATRRNASSSSHPTGFELATRPTRAHT